MAYSDPSSSKLRGFDPRVNMSKQLQNRKTRKNTQENFRRRKVNLISKADDLYRVFGADVFLIIRKRGRYCAYNSREGLDWPPTKEQLVSLFIAVKMVTNKLSGTWVSFTKNKDTSGL
jgi:hypothetical protein